MKLNFTSAMVLVLIFIFATPVAVLTYRALNSPTEPSTAHTTQIRMLDSPLARITYSIPEIKSTPTSLTLECATVAEYAEVSSENYEGWTNYETWCVNLWLNKEASYLWLIQVANNPELTDYQKCEVLKNEVEAANPLIDGESIYSDLLVAAMSSVDWVQIIQAAQEE